MKDLHVEGRAWALLEQMLEQVRDFRWKQMAGLTVIIFTILTVTFTLGGAQGGFYLGFAIAVGGIAIGLLQAYIGSVVNDLLLFRKPFYFWSAVTLLALGSANLLTALVDLKATGVPERLTALAQALQVAGLASSIRLFGVFLFSEPHHNSEDVVTPDQPDTPGFIGFLRDAVPDARTVSELAKSVERDKEWLFRQNISKSNDDIFSAHQNIHIERFKRLVGKFDAAEAFGRFVGVINYFAFGAALLFFIYLSVRAIFPNEISFFVSPEKEKILPLYLSILSVGQIVIMAGFRVNMILNFESVNRTFAAVIGFSLLALAPPLVEGVARQFSVSFIAAGMLVTTVCAAAAWSVLRRMKLKDPKRSNIIDPEMLVELHGLAFSLGLAAVLAFGYGWLLDHLNSLHLLIDPDLKSRLFVGAFQLSYMFLVLGSAYVIVSDLFHSGAIYQRLRDRLFSGTYQRSMAHEIINPLGPVQHFLADPALTTLLKRPITNEPSIERARASLLEGLPIIQTGVRQVFDFANRIREGGMLETDDYARVDLVQVLRQIVADYRTNLPRKYPGRDIVLAFDNDVPIAIARVKLKLIPNVMRILLDNAAESTAPDRRNSITVTINRSRGKLLGYDCVRVTIQDTGIGMNRRHAGQFGKQQRSSKPAGSGSGSAIALTLIKAMQGDVRVVSSASGSGTTIELLFVSG